MSLITDMLLLTNETPGSKPIKALNAWCEEHADGQTFKPVNVEKEAGGLKVFCTRVYACAGNYFPWQKLLEALPTFGWDSYAAETTVLILQHEDHERWVAVHADGCPVPDAEAGILKSYSRGPSKESGVVIRCGAPGSYGFWEVSHGRWVHELEEATVFYGSAAVRVIETLRGLNLSITTYKEASQC